LKPTENKMKNTILIIAGLLVFFCLGFYSKTFITNKTAANNKSSIIKTNKENENHIKLGAFSVSLNVKDIKASKVFYENLGFTNFAGDQKSYIIMKNENALIGLFQGMFQGNILTFNPGWDENAVNTEDFDDIREIQKQLKSKNMKLTAEADEQTSGPASIMLSDPDGNVILIDQHR
jgi:predicted lactoylglutathione lyase